MGKSLDSSYIASPIGRMLSVRLVIIGTVVVIVPFFNSAVFISTADDVTQISVIPVPSSIAFLRWSEDTCRVPVWSLSVVMLMNLCFIITVEC
jgi:predicted anti-sigma-YlaC factor YlaD